MINETIALGGNITLEDATSKADVIVAYVSASLDGGTQNYHVDVNVTNKTLLTTTSATNVAGETVQVQYTEFETAVKARAKELGYVIFS